MFDLNYFDMIRRDEQFNFQDRMKMNRTMFHNLKNIKNKKSKIKYIINETNPFRNENCLIEYAYSTFGEKGLSKLIK